MFCYFVYRAVADLCTGNALDLFWGCAFFESRLNTGWLRSFVVSLLHPGKYRYSTTIRYDRIVPNPSRVIIHQSLCHTDCVLSNCHKTTRTKMETLYFIMQYTKFSTRFFVVCWTCLRLRYPFMSISEAGLIMAENRNSATTFSKTLSCQIKKISSGSVARPQTDRHNHT